jgi:Ribosomal silencing factor during starvation
MHSLLLRVCLLLQRLSDILTYALKKRKLYMAPGITGAEGYDCDDWMIVDCWNLIVHVFEAGYRQVRLLHILCSICTCNIRNSLLAQYGSARCSNLYSKQRSWHRFACTYNLVL